MSEKNKKEQLKEQKATQKLKSLGAALKANMARRKKSKENNNKNYTNEESTN
jgi:hypothetical protein